MMLINTRFMVLWYMMLLKPKTKSKRDEWKLNKNGCVSSYIFFFAESSSRPMYDWRHDFSTILRMYLPKDVQNIYTCNIYLVVKCIRYGIVIDYRCSRYILSIGAFSKSLRKSPSLHEFFPIAILWCHCCVSSLCMCVCVCRNFFRCFAAFWKRGRKKIQHKYLVEWKNLEHSCSV